MSLEPIALGARRVLGVRLVEEAGGKPLAGGLDALLDEAREEGARLGAQAAASRLDEAAERLDAFRADATATLARSAAELAVEVARRLLRAELPAGRYDIEGIVREALQEAASGRGPCVVHLNPADHAALRDVRFRSGTELRSDDGVARGDVHVETSLGLLVRELDGALESIEQRILEDHGPDGAAGHDDPAAP